MPTRAARDRQTTVVVAGATGSLGARVCGSLLRRGARVRALVRSPAMALADLGVELATADLEARGTLPAVVADADVVVSTATAFPRDPRGDAVRRVDRDGNIALVQAAEAAGVRRFVFVSFEALPRAFALQTAKRAVEARLAETSLEGVVLRAGKFMDVWFSPLCGFDAGSGRVEVFGEGAAPVTWVAADDVAELASRVVLAENRQPQLLELGGPEALSQRDVVRVYEGVTGRAFATQVVTAAELEYRYTHASDATTRSLAALMLEAAEGAVIDSAAVMDLHPISRTTVAEFAFRKAGHSSLGGTPAADPAGDGR